LPCCDAKSSLLIIVMFDGKIVGEKENKNVTDRELGLLMAGVA
jgi:ABC-type uncharacterized transport system ATPase subunit